MEEHELDVNKRELLNFFSNRDGGNKKEVNCLSREPCILEDKHGSVELVPNDLVLIERNDGGSACDFRNAPPAQKKLILNVPIILIYRGVRYYSHILMVHMCTYIEFFTLDTCSAVRPVDILSNSINSRGNVLVKKKFFPVYTSMLNRSFEIPFLRVSSLSKAHG